MLAPLVPAALALMKYATPVLQELEPLGGKKDMNNQAVTSDRSIRGRYGCIRPRVYSGVGRRLSNVSQVRDGEGLQVLPVLKFIKLVYLLRRERQHLILLSNPCEEAMLRQALPIAGAGGLTLAGLSMVPGLAGAVGAGGASATRAVTGAAGTAGSAGLGLLPDLEIVVAIGERAKRRKEAVISEASLKKTLSHGQSEYLTGTGTFPITTTGTSYCPTVIAEYSRRYLSEACTYRR